MNENIYNKRPGDYYDELIKTLRKMHDVSIGLAAIMPQSSGDATAKLYNDAADAIETLQIDAVPVVRCRDCVNWDTNWVLLGCNNETVHFCNRIGVVNRGDWFCAYGELKADGEKT